MWTFEQCYYGETGVAKKIQFADSSGGQYIDKEGDEVRFPYRSVATATTLYDEQELPREVLLHDAEHTLLGRTLRAYDSAGRLKRETQEAEAPALCPGDSQPFFARRRSLPNRRFCRVAKKGDSHRRVDPETFATVLLEEPPTVVTTYSHDEQGRCVETIVDDPPFRATRSEFKYDHHSNLIEEISFIETRMVAQETWTSEPEMISDDSVRHTRYELEYDEESNWTSRKRWYRTGEGKDFELAETEKRVIEYY